MQPNPQNSAKIPIIIAAAVLVGAAIYYFYYSGGAAATGDQSSLITDSSISDAQVGQNVLQLLNEVHSLSIDTKFFKSAVYQSLIDFSVAIPTVNVGRPNPFSAIGSFVQSDQSTSASAASAGTSGGGR